MKKNRIYKIIAAAAAAVVISAQLAAVNAAEFNLKYVASEQFSQTQGENQWYYQIYKSGEYVDMDFDAKTGQWSAADTGGTYITRETFHPGNKVNTARVWEAETSGVVRLTPQGNVRKGGIGGVGVTTKIIKNGEVLWTQFIEGTDNIGFGYSIDTEVSAGERIYFEVSTESVAYGATTWNPTVTYVQTCEFTVGGSRVNSMSELGYGDTLTCTLYDEIAIDEEACAYLAVYDSEGRLRALSERLEFAFAADSSRYVETSVTLNAQSESYDGWSAELIVIANHDGRSYPIDISDKICL